MNCQIMTAVSLCISAVVILLGPGDVIRGNLWVVQSEMEGCKVGKKVCGSLRCENFTNVSQNVCLWR